MQNTIRNSCKIFLIILFIASSTKGLLAQSVLQDKELERHVHDIIIKNITARISFEKVSNYYEANYKYKNVSSDWMFDHILIEKDKFYSLTLKEIEDNPLLPNYFIIEYSDYPQFYIISEISNDTLVGFNSPFRYYEEIMRKGIVGINKANSQILFISGYMVLDNIKNVVFLNGFTETSIINYIKLRYYNYNPSEIKVLRKNKKIIFYSSVTKNKYTIRIPDNLSKNDILTICN